MFYVWDPEGPPWLEQFCIGEENPVSYFVCQDQLLKIEVFVVVDVLGFHCRCE